MDTTDSATRRIRDHYNRNSRHYHVVERLSSQIWRQRLAERARGRVLEVGVGTGMNLPYYRSGTEVTGIDLSPGMLDYARKRAHEAKAKVRLLEMDVESMSFPDNSFDTVVSTYVFCAVPHPVRGLKEMRRVCRPDGRVMMLEHTRSSHPFWGMIMDLINPLTVRVIGDHINRDTVHNARMAGLNVEQVVNLWKDVLKYIEATPKGEASPLLPRRS